MQTNDEMLWAIAKKRASFKKQLISYLLVCSFLWAVWLLSGREKDDFDSFPWPTWIMFWWGVGLAYHYANAYLFSRKDSVQQEYEKLKNQPKP
jgi:hypothetical protein